MASKGKTTSAAAAAEEAKTCACGCGQPVKREFKPGHDARFKGQLLQRVDSGDAEARQALIDRGWYTEARLAEREAKRVKKAAKAEVVE